MRISPSSFFIIAGDGQNRSPSLSWTMPHFITVIESTRCALMQESSWVYLPPYSPDLNPIEEFFAKLKAFIKRQWHEYEDNLNQDFGLFLEWCISIVGSR